MSPHTHARANENRLEKVDSFVARNKYFVTRSYTQKSDIKNKIKLYRKPCYLIDQPFFPGTKNGLNVTLHDSGQRVFRMAQYTRRF